MFIDPNHRLSGKHQVTITLQFTPLTSVPPGGFITLNYPVSFFVAGTTPRVANSSGSSVPGLNILFNSTSETSLCFQLLNLPSGIASFAVTITGMSLGMQSFVENHSEVSVQTSSDIYPAFAPAGPLLCPPGSKRNSTAPVAACVICAPGSYQPQAAQAVCLNCDAGTFCSASGLSSFSGNCTPGTYSNSSATMCANCALGFYQPQSSQGECVLSLIHI